MGAVTRHGKKWRAQVCVQGVRRSKVHASKAAASEWVLRQEAELSGAALPSVTLGEAMERYASEVSPGHRGARWEALRLRALRREWDASLLSLAAITGPMVASWRDSRLQQVSPASVSREMTLLRGVFEVARRDWGWVRTNPMQDVRRPRSPPSRKRRVTDDEIDRMLDALRYRRGERPLTLSHQVAIAFLLALETAMRSGEMLGLRWQDVREKAVTLPRTKNGDARDVPLSPAARDLLALMPRDADTVFTVTAGTRDALWRKARAASGVGDLHFHDARAEAIWRLSKKLDVLQLARAIGHRDPKSLMLYYDESADDMADRL